MLSYTKSKGHGFTIVELLIVIVVIAILAAISIVAYNGIQNRAKTSAGQQLANQVAKKAETYNTLNGQYPTFCTLTTNALGSTGNPCSAGSGAGSAGVEAALDNPAVVVRTGAGVASPFGGAAYTTTVSNGNATVAYSNCTGGAPITGGVILYYDYTTSTPTTIAKYVGRGAADCLGVAGGP